MTSIYQSIRDISEKIIDRLTMTRSEDENLVRMNENEPLENDYHSGDLHSLRKIEAPISVIYKLFFEW